MAPNSTERQAEPWHLSKNFTISNVLAVAGAVVAGIIAFNTLEHNVKVNAAEIEKRQLVDNEEHREIEERNDRQQRAIRVNENNIHELRTDTAVIKNNVEQIQRTLDENKADLQTILNAVRK